MDGDARAFCYAMQRFGFDFQYRKKPGVVLQVLGDEGIGKSAIFGRNRTGPGIIMRIYGRYFQWTDDVEGLLGRFNGQSMDRLFCVMEEAGTYRKGHKDHNKMKSMITEGVLTVEIVNFVKKNAEIKKTHANKLQEEQSLCLCNNKKHLQKSVNALRMQRNGELSIL